MRPTKEKLAEKEALFRQGLRYCPSCDTTKPLDEFGKASKDTYGKQRFCFPCTNKINTEKYRPRMSEASRINRNEATKRWRNNQPREDTLLKQKRYNYLRTYGISLEEIDTMYETQKKVCALCFQPMVLGGKNIDSAALDHDHATGKIRALLHNKCNNGLGCYDDSPIKLQQAIEYLQKHNVIS